MILVSIIFVNYSLSNDIIVIVENWISILDIAVGWSFQSAEPLTNGARRMWRGRKEMRGADTAARTTCIVFTTISSSYCLGSLLCTSFKTL